MKARCTTCSNFIDFKACRGAKLSERKCKCGGKYERITFYNTINGINPTGELSTYAPNLINGQTYFYVYQNSKGIYFTEDKPNKKLVEYRLPTVNKLLQ